MAAFGAAHSSWVTESVGQLTMQILDGCRRPLEGESFLDPGPPRPAHLCPPLGVDDHPTKRNTKRRYKRAAKNLWVFCEGTGGQWNQAADALRYMRDRGDERDLWTESARRPKRPSGPESPG